MREIKFRAWDNKHKEWLLGYELENLGGFSLYGECMLLGEWSGVVDTFLFSKNGCAPEDLKVMQYTGLKDKNGKEIYEGDIVSLESMEDSALEVRIGGYWPTEGEAANGVHLTNKEESFVRGVSPFSTDNELEVVGNIYENPELLK